MELSKRLLTVASMVTEGNFLVDVGTDHGFLPIYLMKQKKIPGALAMDVNPGPLSRAQEHIQAYGLEGYIKTRLSDGLKRMEPGEGDTLVLAGMGGGLMLRILEEGKEATASFKELILQPQSEIDMVRKELEQRGLQVIEEDMVLEDGKFYPVMKLVWGIDSYNSEIEYQYGRILLRKKHPVLKQFLENEKTLYTGIMEKLEQQLKVEVTEAVTRRLDEVKCELLQIEQALETVLEKE